MTDNKTTRCPGSFDLHNNKHDECNKCARFLMGYPAGYWYMYAPLFTQHCPKFKEKKDDNS